MRCGQRFLRRSPLTAQAPTIHCWAKHGWLACPAKRRPGFRQAASDKDCVMRVGDDKFRDAQHRHCGDGECLFGLPLIPSRAVVDVVLDLPLCWWSSAGPARPLAGMPCTVCTAEPWAWAPVEQ